MNCSVGLLGEEVRMKESETTTWKIPGVTDEEYFGDYDKYLTASQLKAFADCPWLADYQRRNPETKSDTDALFFGNGVQLWR